MYAFDATGSTIGQIDQVKAFITEQAGPLVMVRHDARIGIVAYRAVAKGLSRSQTEVLPLTHDVDAAIQFVGGIEHRGADSHAAVSDAVAIALDRMPWRPNARCQVYVLADGRIDDGPRAWRIARQHREADRTQLSVWYGSRTRERSPDDLMKLADAGGGTLTVADPAPIPVMPWPGAGVPPSGRCYGPRQPCGWRSSWALPNGSRNAMNRPYGHAAMPLSSSDQAIGMNSTPLARQSATLPSRSSV